MASLNKVVLIGRLGRDPEVITMENGSQKMNVTLATSERFHDRSGNWQEQTEWHTVVAWNNIAADIAEHRRNYCKGDLLYVEGRLRTRQYIDKQGITRYVTEVVADKMMSLSNQRQGQSLSAMYQPASSELTENQGQNEESSPLPF